MGILHLLSVFKNSRSFITKQEHFFKNSTFKKILTDFFANRFSSRTIFSSRFMSLLFLAFTYSEGLVVTAKDALPISRAKVGRLAMVFVSNEFVDDDLIIGVAAALDALDDKLLSKFAMS